MLESKKQLCQVLHDVRSYNIMFYVGFFLLLLNCLIYLISVTEELKQEVALTKSTNSCANANIILEKLNIYIFISRLGIKQCYKNTNLIYLQ